MILTMQPYRLLLTVSTLEEGRWIEDLIAFIIAAPEDCPLRQWCAVEPEHTDKFPRPSVKRGKYRDLTIEFHVPETETFETLAQKLVPLFLKNGWFACGIQKVEDEK